MACRWNYINQTRLVLYLLAVNTKKSGPAISIRAIITIIISQVVLILNSYGTICGGLEEDLSSLTIAITWTFVSLICSIKIVMLHYSWRLCYDEILDYVDGWYLVENDLSKAFSIIFEGSQICCWVTVFWYLGSTVFTRALPPAPYRQFWDQDTPLGFLAAYMLMVVTLLVQMSITTAVDYTVMMCALGIRNRIEDVRENFKKVESDDDMELLIKSVKHHQEILRKIKLFAIPSSPAFFMQIINTTICSCLCTYAAIKQQSDGIEPFLRIITITMCAYSILLIYCWIGQKITDSSDELHNAIYDNLWYRCGTDMRKILHMVSTFTGRPVQISGSFVVKMSLKTFHSVLTESYSSLMVLMRITNKQ